MQAPTIRAAAFSRELQSGDPAQLSDAIAIPAGVAFSPAAVKGLSALHQVTFDAPSFHQSSPSTATIRATVIDVSGAVHPWVVTLVKLAASGSPRRPRRSDHDNSPPPVTRRCRGPTGLPADALRPHSPRRRASSRRRSPRCPACPPDTVRSCWCTAGLETHRRSRRSEERCSTGRPGLPVQAFSFDYSSHNTDWAARPTVAGCSLPHQFRPTVGAHELGWRRIRFKRITELSQAA